MKAKKDCPICLFSSGIVADGLGSECKTCKGSGKISKKEHDKLAL